MVTSTTPHTSAACSATTSQAALSAPGGRPAAWALDREPAAGFRAGRFLAGDGLPERADAVRPPALALDRAAPWRPAGRRVVVVTVRPGYYPSPAAPWIAPDPVRASAD